MIRIPKSVLTAGGVVLAAGAHTGRSAGRSRYRRDFGAGEEYHRKPGHHGERLQTSRAVGHSQYQSGPLFELGFIPTRAGPERSNCVHCPDRPIFGDHSRRSPARFFSGLRRGAVHLHIGHFEYPSGIVFGPGSSPEINLSYTSGPTFASGADESAGYSARVMKCPVTAL